MKTHILFFVLAAGTLPALGAERNLPLKTVEMTVAPSPIPKPALKYELLPSFLDQHQGDAVPMYMKAIALQASQAEARKAFFKHYDQWSTMPRAKLPLDEVRKAIQPFETAMDQAAIAARRAQCRWDPPLREVGDPFSILLPELQELRNLGRILAVRIRVHVAEGKYDEALHDLQTGYAMARQVGQMPFLVSSLVGAAIARTMNDQLEAMLQSRGAPNLYWAVAGLPQPLIDFRPGYEVEKAVVYLMFPQALALRRGASLAASTASPEQSLERLSELTEACGTGGDAKKEFKQAVGLLAPKARQELMANGHSEKEVQALSPAQALLATMLEGYNEVRDEAFKWLALPYPQARAGLDQAEARMRQAAQQPKPPRAVMANMLLPAVGATKFAEARISRELASLGIIEALRAYAAATGKLPATLAEINDLPIPLNPVTGKPFPYRLEKDTAILLADGPADRDQTEYRVKLASR